MSRTVALVVAVLVGGSGSAVIGGAQQSRGKPSPNVTVLTPQDYLDIQQLVSRYAYALDTGANDGYAYADLFAPDGEFVGTGGATTGRDALARLGRLGFVDGRKPTYGVAHFITNDVIEPAADGATGKEYFVLVNIGENGKSGGEFSNVGGHYEDVYVKTADGWRFRRREFIPNKADDQRPRGGAAR